jgi:hypothetical protein
MILHTYLPTNLPTDVPTIEVPLQIVNNQNLVYDTQVNLCKYENVEIKKNHRFLCVVLNPYALIFNAQALNYLPLLQDI